MTSPSSTVPTVLSYLVTQLKAHPDITAASDVEPPLVQYGLPGTYQPSDIIAVGLPVEGTFGVSSLVGSGGAGWIDENYKVEVVVSCYRGGDDPQTVLERAGVLAHAVADVVRADPSLGGAVIVAKPAEFAWEQQLDQEHKGRLALVTVHIEVTARI